jgi:hypothetical protein
MTALLRHRPAGNPSWWASWAVRSASAPLPSEHRYRYRQEFLAELYGMTPSEQLHHATGVLSRVWTLRVALNEPARLKPKEAAMAKPWRCRLRIHRWQRLRNPKVAGTANASSAESKTTPAVGEVPIPSGRLDRRMWRVTTRDATRRRS